MDQLWKFNIERPLAYYKCGRFVSSDDWQHKQMRLKKDFEVIIGLNKSVYIQVGHHQYEVKQGNVLLIPPEIDYYGYAPSQKGASFFWMHFIPFCETDMYPVEKFISHLLASDIEAHRHAINNAVFLPDYFSLSYSDKPFILMKQILDIANASYYSTFSVDYLLTELLIELTEQYSKQLLHQNTISEKTQKFTQILEWIRVNIHEPLNVREVANTFSMNPDHLTRLFKKNIGMSTIRYIHTLKLNKAKELLCTTNKTIKEIAFELRFDDEKYFMKLFKSYEGITPSKFRDAYTKTYTNTVSVDPDIPMPPHLRTAIITK
ncbi:MULTISPECIES: AraC family transcriptional regulator [unclassified Niallia]|uniref:AraC family transcriptional regulator n=1 Tax=unclassified Niallia TaxID=2837522 RepID=UPI001EDC0BF3|nr:MULTISPECIES: AraC family transcriptional regulator [unclassified Niallia]MCM3030447.1 AraC family transcriptional regulator [Niallia sp. MER 6]MDL0434629.1 AraC family transcriptional regulator [Niallia sp. SS-2023]UPO88408.1 AraC family transcriptional regulator [Niallia sp. Man26]